MSEIIKVGMADLKTCVSPDGVTTLGLGSCVGIAIRDPVTKIGGLAHIMLPDSTTIRNSSQNIAKFADTGIDELVRQMEKLGARKARMVAKIAGWRIIPIARVFKPAAIPPKYELLDILSYYYNNVY